MRLTKAFRALEAILLLPALALLLSCTGGIGRPSVVLIIIDTLRADHLSCYGCDRSTSPVIDSLAQAGVMMENVSSQSSWTLPATASIMSGLTPLSHGARMDVPTGNVFGMDPEMPVLPMVMKRNGYATAGFFNVYLLGGDFGFHRGFDLFMCRENGDGLADSTVSAAIDWLVGLQDDRPFFLTVHFFDVHDPYDPPSPFDRYFTDDGARGVVNWEFTPEGGVARPEQRSHLEALYDGEIAYVDHQLGLLFSSLRELERKEGILVVLTADHGEEFLEHGFVGHGRTLYPEITCIPMILAGLERLDSIPSTALCGQYDIFPTILDLCSIQAPQSLEGRSLLDLEPDGRSSVPASGINTGADFHQVSVRNGNRQLIWNADTDRMEMYRLDTDPLALDEVPPDSALLDEALHYWSTPLRWDPVLLEDWRVTPVLRDLGYVK